MNHSTGVNRQQDGFHRVISTLDTLGIKYELVHDVIMIDKGDAGRFKTAMFGLVYGASPETLKKHMGDGT